MPKQEAEKSRRWTQGGKDMSAQTLSELGRLFSSQATYIWNRLANVRNSYESRGDLGPVRFGEETITDLLMMNLYLQGSTLVRFKQTSRSVEAISGSDFELWLGSEGKGWFRCAIQAKKLDLRTDRYRSLSQSNPYGRQIDLLENYASNNRAAPLYCLYNHTDHADGNLHWHCGTGPVDLTQFGCSITPSSNIRKAIDERGGRNFKSIHEMSSTLPWRCLVCRPLFWYAFGAMSGCTFEVQRMPRMPFLDPGSCYHETIPSVLRRDRSADIATANERDSSLNFVLVDEEHEIVDSTERLLPEARSDFRERYHRDTGVPKVAAVIEMGGLDVA